MLTMNTKSHCYNQASHYCQLSLAWLAVSSALDTQTKHVGWKLPHKRLLPW